MDNFRFKVYSGDKEGLLRMGHEELVDAIIKMHSIGQEPDIQDSAIEEIKHMIVSLKLEYSGFHPRRAGRKRVYGDDIRERVLSLRASGETYKNISQELGISFSTVRRICSSQEF